MKLICESIKDIDSKIEIFCSEKNRLIREKNKELSIDPFRISSIDLTKPIVDSYRKYESKVIDEKYVSELQERIDGLDKEISFLTKTRRSYLVTLSKMIGIEYRLYSYLLQGYNPTKAIQKVAEENDIKGVKPATERGIIPYYKRVKKICQLH